MRMIFNVILLIIFANSFNQKEKIRDFEGEKLSENFRESSSEPPRGSAQIQQLPGDQTAMEAQRTVQKNYPVEVASDENTDAAAEDTSNHIFFWDVDIAQWVMAFTGIAALFLSAWAVGLLYFTLKATRRMVLEAGKTTAAAEESVIETRRIGEAQVRAYPSAIAVCIRGVTNGLPNVVINIRNSGNSPALRMRCRGRLMISYQEPIQPPGTFQQCCMEISLASNGQISVPPNSEYEAGVFVPHDDGDAERRNIMNEMSSGTSRENPFWMVNVFFSWFDVFGEEYCFYINAEQLPDGRRAGTVVEDPMSENILGRPLYISYQSESRKIEKS